MGVGLSFVNKFMRDINLESLRINNYTCLEWDSNYAPRLGSYVYQLHYNLYLNRKWNAMKYSLWFEHNLPFATC